MIWGTNVPGMAPTDTFRLVDRIIPGGLHAFLSTARDNDETFAQMSYRLRAEHDVEVTQETVRRWCVALGLHVVTEKAS